MPIVNEKLNNRILDKIKKGEPLRLNLSKRSVVKMEKTVPYLIVNRFKAGGKDDFSSKLGKTEVAYVHGEDSAENDIKQAVRQIAETLSDKFKGFLILEIWVSDDPAKKPFNVYIAQKGGLEVAEKLQKELDRIKLQGVSVGADLKKVKSVAPPGFQPLMDLRSANKSAITIIGLEVAPVYMNISTGKPYPLILRELRSQFSKAIRKAFFEFIRTHTSYNVSNFQMLGTTKLEDKVFEIDDRLGHYSNMFDFLLLVTPINTDEAWEEFKKSKYSKRPAFHYRPMPIDPELIKRAIYNLPIEEISDPTIAFLFRDKRKEVDRMLNMMTERDKPDFMHSSLQIFGPIDERLLDIAKAILVAIEPVEPTKKKKVIYAPEFAKMAEAELHWLKKQDSSISTAVRVRDDIEGILVSRGTLNINKNFTVSQERAFSLLQHEVGTHVVTYYNGKAQPLKLFYIGVPGYEELQEGMAVFSEYLTGGLTLSRMRTLAARVVTVDLLISGSSFVDAFYVLVDKYGFSLKAAFSIVTRVYRGGGLTKDAVYLKGLLNIIEYIKKGKDLEALLIGKIRQDYLPIVQELIHRKILRPAPIRPRYLDNQYLANLKNIQDGGNVFNMIHG